MENFIQFFNVFLSYCRELWLSIAVGFLLSGLFYEFIPGNIVEKHLGERGIKPILLSSVVGVLLPVCCFGSLPIAMTLRRKGARLGPVLAFLVATPATSVTALIVTWKLLGVFFTVYIFFAVIVMGLMIGFIGNYLKVPIPQEEEQGDCCHESETTHAVAKNMINRLKAVFIYAFITLPKEIGVELLLGVAIASLIMVIEPLQEVVRQYLTGALGYAFVLIFGLITYVCSTASVPMADALIQSGLSMGQALTYLLVGPITSYGTIFVLKKKFGGKILVIYLVFISFSSLMAGIICNIFYNIS